MTGYSCDAPRHTRSHPVPTGYTRLQPVPPGYNRLHPVTPRTTRLLTFSAIGSLSLAPLSSPETRRAPLEETAGGFDSSVAERLTDQLESGLSETSDRGEG